MLAHITLKFKTAELQQEEVLEDLPKAIRSGIAQHLFRSTVESSYLFREVSEDFIVQMVISFLLWLPTVAMLCSFWWFSINLMKLKQNTVIFHGNHKQLKSESKKFIYYINKYLSGQTNILSICCLPQVPDMRAEYYPPKVDIVIQNEISTDFYIIVSGAVVRHIAWFNYDFAYYIRQYLIISSTAGHNNKQERDGTGM